MKCNNKECQHNSDECQEWSTAQYNYYANLLQKKTPRDIKSRVDNINRYTQSNGRQHVFKTIFPHRTFVNGNLIEVTE